MAKKAEKAAVKSGAAKAPALEVEGRAADLSEAGETIETAGGPLNEQAVEMDAHRAGRVELLRAAAPVLEEISNLKAPAKEKEHPFNVNRRGFLAALKAALGVLGREKDEKETPANEEQIETAVRAVFAQLVSIKTHKAYARFSDDVSAWLRRAGS
jgi:voltage-gated potassium channel Kch